MDQKNIVFVLCAFILLLSGHAVRGRKSLKEDIKNQLKVLNGPAITKIKTHYGDVFRCVEAHRQPAFHHPLLENHKIQAKPEFMVDKDNEEGDDESGTMHSCIGLNGTGCPFGTVPIRRISRKEYLAAKEQLRVRQKRFAKSTTKFNNGGTLPGTNMHAYLGVVKDRIYSGSRARINIWEQKLQQNYWTTTNMVVARRPNAFIEVGWMVNPSIFNDSRSRLYASWTNDNYENTGCINTFCQGFVQVDNRIPLGVYFRPMSVVDGPQYEIRVQVNKDLMTGAWWLYVKGIAIGYWPAELIPEMEFANYVAWGATSAAPAGAEFAPAMGTGKFPANQYRKACYIRRLQLINSWGYYYDAPNYLVTDNNADTCYRIESSGFNKDDGWRRHLYLGGPECGLP